MSVDRDVVRLNIDNFRPKSAYTQTSSSLPPKVTNATFVTETGFEIVAENLESTIEYILTISDEPTSIRVEEGDQRNQEIESASSDGREITRNISRERVDRMLSFEGRIVATHAPSGLGRV